MASDATGPSIQQRELFIFSVTKNQPFLPFLLGNKNFCVVQIFLEIRLFYFSCSYADSHKNNENYPLSRKKSVVGIFGDPK